MSPREILTQLNELDENTRLEASQHLRRLRDRSLLQQKGKGAETYYLPTQKLLAPWENRSPDLNPPGSTAQSGNPAEQSRNLGPKARNLPSESGNLSRHTDSQVPRFVALPGLPVDLENALAALKTKMLRPEMEDLVWRLCAWREFSTGELAQLLRRNRDYIQSRVITPMLRAGRLTMTIPDQPNHLDQRYRAATG
jgi:ATP-dependent DNA helicase RecG